MSGDDVKAAVESLNIATGDRAGLGMSPESVARVAEIVVRMEGEIAASLDPDAAFVEKLNALGPTGRKRARKPASGHAGRRSQLIVAVWGDLVRPMLSSLERSRVIAVPRVTVDNVIRVGSARTIDVGTTSGNLHAVRDDGVTQRTDLTLDVTAAGAVTAHSAVSMTDTPYLWHIITAIARRTREREIRGDRDPHIHEVSGGVEGLAKFFGINSHNIDTKELLSAAHGLSHLTISGRNMVAAKLFTLHPVESDSRAGGRPRAGFKIEAHLLLRPAKAKEIGLISHFDVPLIMPSMVPVIGDRRTRGRTINAVERLMIYAHDQRLQIADKGELVLTMADWRRIGDEAGLYRRQHADAQMKLFAKLQEAPRSPELPFDRVAIDPLLVEVGPDRYRFGDSFTPEWQHFIEQGKVSKWQAEKKRRGIRKRERERRRPDRG